MSKSKPKSGGSQPKKTAYHTNGVVQSDKAKAVESDVVRRIMQPALPAAPQPSGVFTQEVYTQAILEAMLKAKSLPSLFGRTSGGPFSHEGRAAVYKAQAARDEAAAAAARREREQIELAKAKACDCASIAPTDLITATVAVATFHISKATIKRSIEGRALTDYRPEGHKPNAQYLLSESELSRKFARRRNHVK